MTSSSHVGAFFDLDGTLVPSPSLEWRFIAYLLSRDEIAAKQAHAWMAHFAKNIRHGWCAATKANKHYLAQIRESLATDWGEACLSNPGGTNLLPLFSEGLERVMWHVARGHRIIFVSGTPEPLARVAERRAAQILVDRGADYSIQIYATPLEVAQERWTGRLAGVHMNGAAKAESLRKCADRYGLKLGESYAYGDSWSDVPMLEIAGHPVAVNPEGPLERVAYERGWHVRVWKSVRADEIRAISPIPFLDEAQ